MKKKKRNLIAILIALIVSISQPTVCLFAETPGHLTKRGGVYYNEYEYKETWYNLNMDRCVQIMREKGYSEEDYPYKIREDGVKCLGNLVMVAADLNLHSKGDIVNTSLGLGIVVDTGSAIKDKRLDICVDW